MCILIQPSDTVNRQQVKRGEVTSKRLLTEAAKARIASDLARGLYEGRENEVDPPYMAPSPNPEDYSHVR